MEDVRINKASYEDIDDIVELWYKVSIETHSFISDEYWERNKSMMKEEYLPMSETYIAQNNKKLLGFVSMIDEYLAALFVRTEIQGMGIGSQLLDFVKEKRERIELKVYKKNDKSIRYYRNRRFEIISDSIDKGTGEIEFIMEWEK